MKLSGLKNSTKGQFILGLGGALIVGGVAFAGLAINNQVNNNDPLYDGAADESDLNCPDGEVAVSSNSGIAPKYHTDNPTWRCVPENADLKPVLYLYPEVETRVSVEPQFIIGDSTVYPAFNEARGWSVIASPDGTLRYGDDVYRYLFWEGQTGAEYDIQQGTVVAREDIVAFLENALSSYSLNSSERQDFITFWADRLKKNENSFISFVNEQYVSQHGYNVQPEPDTNIRIFMVYMDASQLTKSFEAQVFEPADTVMRNGFTFVEWGGREL